MRTEEEILKEFEELGYDIFNAPGLLKLNINGLTIIVAKYTRCYECYCDEDRESYVIDMLEHKLLHELFECWGWLCQKD